MKIIFSIFSALFFAITTAFAQAPQAFSYQAIANNANGTPVVNGSVKVRISILDNTATGAVLYTETHTKTTNAQGLFNLNIGQGAVTAGTFADINWAVNPKFVKVELDPAGGTNYTTVGTSQLLSVPYALYAGSAGNAGQWATNANTRLAYNSGDVEIGQNGSGLWLTSPNGTKYKISVNDNGQLSLPTSTTTGNTPAQLYMYGSFNNWDANTALLMSFVSYYDGSQQTNYAFKGFKYLTAGTTYKFLPALGSTTPYGVGSNNTLATNGNAFSVASDGFYEIEVGYTNFTSTMTLSVNQISIRPGAGSFSLNSSTYNSSTNTFTSSIDAFNPATFAFFLSSASNFVSLLFNDVLLDGTFEMKVNNGSPGSNIPISAGPNTINSKLNFNGTGTYTIN
jgi:hypothetical protein